jgi:Flp pilus assembly protein TadG
LPFADPHPAPHPAPQKAPKKRGRFAQLLSSARSFARPRLQPFARAEDGAMMVFGVIIFGLMLAAGGIAFDLMRYEAERDRLQSTLDRAVLAAASMSQETDRRAVVLDYFAKAGLSDYINPEDVVIDNGGNASTVIARAAANVPLHHGVFRILSGSDDAERVDVLVAEAVSGATTGVGDVEISMVLDVSWSMNATTQTGQSRLENLKDAAQSFLSTVYENSSDGGTVTVSVVPYSTQVSADAALMSYFSRTNSHEDSFCLNFAEADYNTTEMFTAQASSFQYEQALHFDPWTNEHTGFDVGEYMFYPNCPVDDRLHILPWETDQNTLFNYIEAFQPQWNTSTDIGAKWGAALLDPSMQEVATGMIADSHVDPAVAGRPFDYDSGESMKVLIFMTDGDNTTQPFMGDFREGESFVWKYHVEGTDDVYYSIWPNGEKSSPDLTYETREVYEQVGTEYGNYICVAWYTWWGYTYCDRYEQEQIPIYGWVTREVPKWFVAYNTDFDGYNSNTQFAWLPTPYDGDNDHTDNGVNAVRMTWQEVWAEIPPEVFSDDLLKNMLNSVPSLVDATLNWSEIEVFESAIDSHGRDTKDTRYDAICGAAKDNNVIVFTIGVEVSDHSDIILEDCASSTNHYYDVQDLDVLAAFSSIATQLNQLRLIQ